MIKLYLLIFSFCLLGPLVNASELSGVLENNRGVTKLGEQKPVEAFDRFTGALGELPYSGAVHYNLGTSFLINKEFEKALSEYHVAITNSPTQSNTDKLVRFSSYFNSGVALTALKRTDEALEAYQRALGEKPDSIETKTNMELLIQSSQGQGEGDGDKKDKDDKDSKNDKKNQNGNGKDDKKDQKDPKDKDKDQKDKQKQQDQPKAQPTPRPFKSQELNQQDVGKILDELKQQEEQIRARMQNEQTKDAPPDKDW